MLYGLIGRITYLLFINKNFNCNPNVRRQNEVRKAFVCKKNAYI